MNPINYFPRGLRQPAGGFRFSAEALLLASFVRLDATITVDEVSLSGRQKSFADLGTGCGVVGLAVLLRALQALSPLPEPENLRPQDLSRLRLHGFGYELATELCMAARENAELLGLSGNFSVLEQDLAQVAAPVNSVEGLMTEGLDFVTANPPYRLLSEGRAPASWLRRLALFEEHGSLEIFARAAANWLRPGGSFYCVYPVRRQQELLDLLPGLGLWPRRLLPINGQPECPVPFFLVEACKEPAPMKESGSVLEIMPVLTLQEGNKITGQALRFCPFLACSNSR